jgi:hypothetical protein
MNEEIILIIIRALGVLGTKGIQSLLKTINEAVDKSPNKIDNELFNLVLKAIQDYEPTNPI